MTPTTEPAALPPAEEASTGGGTAEAEHQFQFFVFIVESPSGVDIYHRRSEGDLVVKATALDEIPCVVRTAIDRRAFQAALQVGLAEAMHQFPARLPLLHISAHGSNKGIELSNGEFVSWSDLRTLLAPINQALSGFLIVCMSACKGYSACAMAMQTDGSPHPYWVLVANTGQPTWSDTAVAYSTLYHLLARRKTIPEAVEAMKLASDDHGWICETAHEAKTFYLDYLKAGEIDLQAAGRVMDEVADTVAPPDAKALEHGGLPSDD